MEKHEIILKEIHETRRVYERLEKHANTKEARLFYTLAKGIINDLQDDINEVLK